MDSLMPERAISEEPMRMVWRTDSIGRQAPIPADSTSKAFTEFSETGTQISTVVPTPVAVSTEMSPFSRATASRTTSKPMPRPESVVAVPVVLTPPCRIKLMASFNPRDSASGAEIAPFFTAALRIASTSIPAPSSRQTKATRAPFRSTVTSIFPGVDLLAQSQGNIAHGPPKGRKEDVDGQKAKPVCPLPGLRQLPFRSFDCAHQHLLQPCRAAEQLFRMGSDFRRPRAVLSRIGD